MQIERFFVSYCPLLLDGDVLSISPNLVVRGERIYDTTAGALHCVQAPGGQILQKLSKGTTLSELKKFCQREETPIEHLYDILGFCNLTGCLVRKRSILGRYKALKKLLIGWLMGIRYKPLSKRVKASPISIAIQLAAASQPIIWATIGVMMITAASGLLPFNRIVWLGASWLATFLLTTYAHELAHYVVIKMEQLPVDTIRHRLRFALLHRTLDPSMELLSALAGPLVGTLLCAGGIIWGVLSDVPFLYTSCVVVIVIHLGSLLPWYGDGASLRMAWRQRSYQ